MRTIKIQLFLVTIFASFLATHSSFANINIQPVIPQNSINILIAQLNSVDKTQSSTKLRRAYKNIIRQSQALIEDQASASNRFQVLALIMNTQKKMLAIEKSNRNREDLLKTCAGLASAPDAYAEYRFQADMLLSDKALSDKDADVEERLEVLKNIIQRYRDTPGELKSLMTAILLSGKLVAVDHKARYLKTLAQRFAGNAKAITFQRKVIGWHRMDLIFSGTFDRLDKTSLKFPNDRLGHPIIALFWSKKNDEYKEYIQQLKNEQELHPEQFEIFSFNLDELDDAGASILGDIGLKCSVMRLPGGSNSETYRIYGLNNPHAILINEIGHTISASMAFSAPKKKAPEVKKKAKKNKKKKAEKQPKTVFSYPSQVLSQERYQSHLQSMLNGDFLILDENSLSIKKNSLPLQLTTDIQSCFIQAPMRYRSTPSQSYANYDKAEKLCSNAIPKYTKSPDLWRLRSSRIIALMGMWNAKGEPKFLEKAVNESRIVLNETSPNETKIAARYCLAKNALRQNILTSKNIVTKFIGARNKESPNALTLAAASILSLEGNDKDLHDYYRKLFLATQSKVAYSVLSFLRNRYHRFYLFQGDISYWQVAREHRYYERHFITNNDLNPITKPFPALKLKQLDGKFLDYPDKTADKLTIFMFIEPPPSGNLNLPHDIYKLADSSVSKKRHKSTYSGMIQTAHLLAEAHLNKGIQVIAAFLSEDTTHIKALVEKYNFPCQVAMVSQGLQNPIVRELDIFAADRMPNTFLVRRDGTIAWYVNGLPFRAEPKGLPYLSYLGMRCQIYRCEVEAGYRALEKMILLKLKKYSLDPI